MRVYVQAGEHVSKNLIVFGFVVLSSPRPLERVALVAEGLGFSAGEIAVYVEYRDNRLLQNVLAEDAVLRIATRVIGHPADMSIGSERNVLTEVQHAPGERGVDADAPPLEVVVLRCAALIEVVEGDTVRVLVAPAGDIEVVIRHRRRTEDGVPPVGAFAAGHDQAAGGGIRSLIYTGRPAIRVERGNYTRACGGRGAGVRPDVNGDRGCGGVPVDVGRDRVPGVFVARLHHLEVVQRVRDEYVIVAAYRSRDPGSRPQCDLGWSGDAPFGGLDENHTVTGTSAVNRSRRGILQDLNRRNVVGVQKVEVGFLNRSSVDDIKRIIVLEGADTADSDRAA